MLNFTELSSDGNDLELLVREILFNKGYRVYWSGKGPDGGQDLLCFEDRDSFFVKDSKTWLIQCKHNAISGKSVGISDLDDIVDSCNHHNAEGYLLVCSTYPSSKVVERLEGISNNQKNNILATYWDAIKLEQILTTPELWRIAQRFFPISANISGWQIYATEKPNLWIAIFKGYYFHLSNRIGSTLGHQFKSIEDRVAEIGRIELPQKHFIRIRAIYYDDKNGNYSYYLDYMYPQNENPIGCCEYFKQILGDDCALDDGQFYHFDIIVQSYFEYSDHYDPDHSDYYMPYITEFYWGQDRNPDFYHMPSPLRSWYYDNLDKNNETVKEKDFKELAEILSNVPGIKLIRAVNSNIENIDKFHRAFIYSDIVKKLNIEPDLFFSARFYLECESDQKIIGLANALPQDIIEHFRLAKSYIVMPEVGYAEDECPIFELTVSILPVAVKTKYDGRVKLNTYFKEIKEAVMTYCKTNTT